MKSHTACILLLSIIIFCSLSKGVLAAEDDGEVRVDGLTIITESGNSSYFKSLLYNVWGHLRALNSQHATGRAPGDAVATIGMRGARLSTAQSKPDNNATDKLPGNEELAQFISAQRYAESGQLERAVSALDAFIDSHTGSMLRPNALFALSVSQANLGEIESAKWTLIDFHNEYPAHPLIPDAERILEEIEIIELLEE